MNPSITPTMSAAHLPPDSPAGNTLLVKMFLAGVLSSGVWSFLAHSAPAPAANQLPTGGVVTAGAASINSAGKTMTINQTSNRAVLNWNNFDIGSAASVNFVQPSTSAVALNRINSANPSQIYGNLTANGQVFFSNPAGMYFAPGANVNVGAIVATTHQMSDADFMKGSNTLERQGASGSIINEGMIQTGIGGYIALLAPSVRNSGLLLAQQGTVALAGGERITLNFGPLSALESLTIQESQLATLIENRYAIRAPGGLVILSAKALNQLAGSVINSGIIAADGVATHGGRILLEASSAIDHSGTISADANSNSTGNGGNIILLASLKNPSSITSVSGSITAKAGSLGGDGGFIETSATKVRIADSAQINTTTTQGKTGIWLIDPNDFTVASTGADITGVTLGSNLASTNITIDSNTGTTIGNGDIFVNDRVDWSANTTLTLNAYRNIAVNQSISATGASGKVKLYYGQGTLASGNAASYSISAPINLKAGDNFYTKLGSDGAEFTYKVITDLGANGSVTGTDLQGMRGNVLRNYVLGADIDASATNSWSRGTGFIPIGSWPTSTFKGIFDGLGHSISNLKINNSSNVGLFGATNGATIRNVGLIGGSVNGSSSAVGGLVGYSLKTSIINSYTTGNVAGYSQVGGLVGFLEGGAISNSYATGTVTTKGGDYAGGLVGYKPKGTINNSYASGNVSGSAFTGGLVGYNAETIAYSYASGNVTGTTNFAGGLVGSNIGSITYSYASGAVNGVSYVGGLVGSNKGPISNSYATGVVTATGLAAGGLVGDNIEATIEDSYSSGSVSGWKNAGALVGRNTGSLVNSFGYGEVTVNGNVISVATTPNN